jgi:hypothetical protein
MAPTWLPQVQPVLSSLLNFSSNELGQRNEALNPALVASHCPEPAVCPDDDKTVSIHHDRG